MAISGNIAQHTYCSKNPVGCVLRVFIFKRMTIAVKRDIHKLGEVPLSCSARFLFFPTAISLEKRDAGGWPFRLPSIFVFFSMAISIEMAVHKDFGAYHLIHLPFRVFVLPFFNAHTDEKVRSYRTAAKTISRSIVFCLNGNNVENARTEEFWP